MDGQLLDYVAVKNLEKMPTKLELIATIARLINQVRPGARLMRLPRAC
jgi:predicted house-cleaning noncanonical NTP pyrophosphatase (MazG superfamily)